MTFVIRVFFPVIAQVTRDSSGPACSIVKTVSFRDLNGFSNVRSMSTVEGALADRISSLPWPARRFPDQL